MLSFDSRRQFCVTGHPQITRHFCFCSSSRICNCRILNSSNVSKDAGFPFSRTLSVILLLFHWTGEAFHLPPGEKLSAVSGKATGESVQYDLVICLRLSKCTYTHSITGGKLTIHGYVLASRRGLGSVLMGERQAA